MRLAFALALVSSIACVEANHGSRVLANFDRLGPPGAIQVMGGAPLLTPHYEMWATIRQDLVVDILTFDITPVVDLHSPCLMYDAPAEQAYHGEVKAGEPVVQPLPRCDQSGVPCTAAEGDKYWILSRAGKLYGSVFAVTSASDGFAGQTTLDLGMCDDSPRPDTPAATTSCWLDHAHIVAGTFALTRNNTPLKLSFCGAAPANDEFCLEPSSGRVTFATAIKNGAFTTSYRAHLLSGEPKVDPSKWTNANRLRVCALPLVPGQPGYDPNFYIGNVLQMSAPRGGRMYGLVNALDPDASLQLGGIDAVVPFGLAQASEIFITVEDHSVGSPDPGIGDRVDPSKRGAVVLLGRTNFNDPNAGRGVMTVDLSAPGNIAFPGGFVPGGHISVYVNLDDDSVQF